MGITSKHVAVLVDNYFEQSEFEEPISAIKDAGGEVTVIATNSLSLQGMDHVMLTDAFTADLLLKQASSTDYDALILPGGAINADQLRVVGEAQEWVHDFLDSGKLVAAICHAPWLLASADVLEGRQLTSYLTIRDDIENAGGEWVNRAVVVDDNLVTSRGPDDLPFFNGTIIKMLNDQPSSALQTDSETIVANSEEGNEKNLRMMAMGYDAGEDNLDVDDVEEIVGDEDLDDPDEVRPRNIEMNTEQDDAR